MFFFRETRWKKVENSRSQIIKAGKIIKNDDSTQDDIIKATEIIDNWRAAHAYPMHIIYIHLKRIANNKNNIIVAERLKRLSSITNKLKREPSMSLWYMQDLGGCRFIVPTIKDVYSYSEQYKHSRIRHKLINQYNYIKSPKKSGYRSLHLVYQYHSDKNEDYNKNMLIEIQFRTHLQHLWATAVETLGLFTDQALKSGQGNEDIKRFFVLVSSLFALREGTPVVPNTSNDSSILVDEIKEIDKKQHILDMLSAIRVATDCKSVNKFKSQGYCILILNYITRKLKIMYYKPSQNEAANNTYTKLEHLYNYSQYDAVLVSVSSFKTLRTAYPNYFLDIGEFIKILKTYLNN